MTPRRVELRKYHNRRFYDATQSRQATMDDIVQMIRGGSEVVVTDSKSGEDITAEVLTQIVLKRNTGNLKMLPIELLHHMIRTNETLFREFVETYFRGVVQAYLESRRQFDEYARLSLDLQASLQDMNPAKLAAFWPRQLMAPFNMLAPMAPPRESEAKGNGDLAALRRKIDELSQQVEQLRASQATDSKKKS